MTDKYQAEAIATYTKLTDLRRRAAAEAKAKEVRLPDYFTIDERFRAKPSLLIQALVEDFDGDPDNISPGVQIAVEKRLEVILRRYNVKPEWIFGIEKIMSEKKIKNWK